MTEAAASKTVSGWGGWPARFVLGAGMVVAFALLLHNYCINLLPEQRQIISPEMMQADPAQPSFAYFVPFRGGVPDQVRDMRSRLRFYEDGKAFTRRVAQPQAVRQVGGDMFVHGAEGIVFASTDNTDPRTNGRLYEYGHPLLYSPAIGRASAAVLVLGLGGLLWRRRGQPGVRARGDRVPWAGFWWGAALVVFMVGLYCNTGTRAPYGVTFFAHVDPATGHLYNTDHIHFRTMFDFVDGQPKAVWDRALMLRRILYPVMAYPAMKLWGFEAGGVGFNLLLSLAGFTGASWWLWRRQGVRAALMGAWLLATYPGFAYWVGMPYMYAAIAPGALVLMIALTEIGESASFRRTLAWSAVMGVTYLAYDFAPIFLPATLGMLLWRRRWTEAAAAAVMGALPLAAWLLMLRGVFGQGLENSNSATYRAVFSSLLENQDWAAMAAALPRKWDVALAVFFGANFLFLPALFLGVWLLNPLTSRVRCTEGERMVWLVTGGLFLVLNLSTTYSGGWNMSGSWIARLYQGTFPAMIFFIARWWQALPPLGWRWRLLTGGGLALAAAGNLLILFGPLAGDPAGVSEEAFYRFYSHGDDERSAIYQQNLKTHAVRLLGFGRPVP